MGREQARAQKWPSPHRQHREGSGVRSPNLEDSDPPEKRNPGGAMPAPHPHRSTPLEQWPLRSSHFVTHPENSLKYFYDDLSILYFLNLNSYYCVLLITSGSEKMHLASLVNLQRPSASDVLLVRLFARHHSAEAKLQEKKREGSRFTVLQYLHLITPPSPKQQPRGQRGLD